MAWSSAIMTLILDFRAGISDCRSRHVALDVRLASQRDFDQNPGPGALRRETDRSTQHGGSFPHALDPQAARGGGHAFHVKASSVIGHGNLQGRRRTIEYNADCLC